VTSLIAGVGYIGSALALDLLRGGERVIGLDNFYSSNRESSALLSRAGDLQMIEADLRDRRSLRRAGSPGIDVAYLLAAQASADDRSIPIALTEDVNLRGARQFFEVCVEAGVSRIVVAGSMRIYGQPLPELVREDTPYGVQRDYTHLSKVYLEHLARLFVAVHGLHITVVRIGVVHGPSPMMKDDPRFMTVLNRFCRQAVAGELLTIHPGAGYVPLIHIDEVVGGLRQAAEREWPGFRAVNLAGDLVGLDELAETVRATAMDLGLNVQVSGAAEASLRRPRVFSSLARPPEGARRSVVASVREMIDYYRARG